MKKPAPWIPALALLALAGSAWGQNLTGVWQGSLKIPQAPRGELRTVIRIATTDTDSLKAQFYSIDQGAAAIQSSSVTLQSGTVKIVIPGIGGTFEGKTSADGNSITGTWSQGPRPMPLTLTRATEQTAWAIPEPPARPKPMADDADPVFEVATIKPSDPSSAGRWLRMQVRQFSTFNTSLASLLNFAYGVQIHQIVGAPAWLDSGKYDLSARPDGEGQPSAEQFRVMVQKLLADRFQLRFHRDRKELSVYTLTVLKTGAKLTPSDGDPKASGGVGFGALGRLTARNASMDAFAKTMQTTALDRPVVDQTGLTGRYDFALSWTPDEFQFADVRQPGMPPMPANADGPDLFTAIQQQLGLKLEATKAVADVMVIDHVEKPSAN